MDGAMIDVERKDLIDVIVEKWFAHSSVVRTALGIEGVDHDIANGTLTFGCRAGPSIGPEMLAHEMAHFVELPEERIAQRNWGFTFGTPNISQFGIDTIPTTWAATKREIRAWAWQSTVLDDIGFELPIEELVRSAVHMNDFYLVPGEDRNEKLALIADMVADRKRGLTIVAFDEIWFDRVGKLPDMFASMRERNARTEAAMNGDILKSWSVTRKDEDGLQMVINERSDGVHSCFEVYGKIEGELCFDATADFEAHEDALRYAARMFGEGEIVCSEAPIDPRLAPSLAP
jgi:hypothetical protein